ncbi:MAG: hypothetical protein JKY45_00115 [Emcibacter sp.]|nr:hypothetical protein [Emcibacter sp.]
MGGIMTICAYYTTIWNAPFFSRTFGWAPAEYMKYTGFSILAIGPVRIICTGFLIDGFTMTTAAGPATLMAIAPANMRAQVMAFYYMFISMTGLLIGPSSVPFITDIILKDEMRINESMSYVALFLCIPAVILIRKVPGAYKKLVTSQ